MKIINFIIFILFSLNALASPEEWKSEWPKTDFTKYSIDLDKVISNSPPKDGVVSIDNPIFLPADEINFKASEPVISLEVNGEARAYPLRILLWHELVNDSIQDLPVLITYSPLCNAATVFKREINEKASEFGVSGKLHNSNMIMYDRNTESWWQQYTGEAIAGSLNGTKLEKLPSRVEALYLFKKRFPKGKVLVPNNPIAHAYGGTPYPGYERYFPFLYNGEYNGKLPQMTYMVVVGDEAWPLPVLMIKGYAVKGNIVIKWQPNQNSVLDSKSIDLGGDIGNIIVQERQEDGSFIDAPYNVTFAFVFDAFHKGGIINMQ